MVGLRLTDEPAHPLGRDCYRVLVDVGEPLLASQVARLVEVEVSAVRASLHALAVEGWVLRGAPTDVPNQRGLGWHAVAPEKRILSRSAEHLYPSSWRTEGRTPVRIRTPEEKALERLLGDCARRDPVGTVLLLIPTPRLLAELQRREAADADPFSGLGLPPAEPS